MNALKEIKNQIIQFGLEKMGRYYASYRGFVADTDDPESRGRILIKVPQIFGQQTLNRWAEPKGQYSAEGQGVYFIPAKGQRVWVSFENGDPRFPIWEYGPWAKNSIPESAVDDDKTRYVTLQFDGTRITFDKTDKILTLVNGENEIKLGEENVFLYGDNEKAALGDTLKDKMESLIDTVITIDGTATGGANAVPLNTLKQTLGEILSDKVHLS